MAVAESIQVARRTDRRQAPRRAEDVALHYARENLIAAVLSYWDTLAEDDIAEPWTEAIAMYREAEAAAQAVRS